MVTRATPLATARWRVVFVLLCGSALLIGSLTAWGKEPDPVSLLLYTRLVVPPIKLRFGIVVEPHPDNRQLCFVLDGPEYSQSCWDLDGESARTWWVDRVIGASGDYVAMAVVARQTNGRTTVFQAQVPFLAAETVPFLR